MMMQARRFVTNTTALRRYTNSSRNNNNYHYPSSTQVLFGFDLSEKKERQVRSFHSTPARDSTVIVGALGVTAAAFGAKYAVEKVSAYFDRPKSERASYVSRNFYPGPFEDQMTRREAALILGVRESATADRIRNSHRKLVILNHPDTGGSTFLSSKINEAKELLLTGKQ